MKGMVFAGDPRIAAMGSRVIALEISEDRLARAREFDRKIGVDALFTDRWRLDQADEAYRLFDRQTGGKGVFLL